MWWPLTLTYMFMVIRPWLRKSCPLCSVYGSGWSLSIFSKNDHYYLRVCRVLCFFFKIWKFEFLAIFKKFSALTLKKKSAVLDGFFRYLAQMITSVRGCVAYNDLWPWPISSRSFGLGLYIFKVIWPWPWKSCPLCSIYSSWWILSIFGTNDH